MAATYQLARDTRVFIRDFDTQLTGANNSNTWWEIPVLDGFSFTQGIDTTSITMTEATDTSFNSRRGQVTFNTALAPAEWSLTTYVRPFIGAGGRRTNTANLAQSVSGVVDNVAGYHHAVEEPLWSYFVMGRGHVYSSNNGLTSARAPNRVWGANTSNTGGYTTGVIPSTSSLDIDFSQANKVQMRQFELMFASSSYGNTTYDTNYRLIDAVVNAVTINFDIEGIAQLEWSGFARKIEYANTAQAVSTIFSHTANNVNEAINKTDNFIRNRLSTVNVATQQAEFGGSVGTPKYYNIVLTGGSITMENNITYVTPEEMAKVNIPLGHFAGTRTVSGNFTAYLDDDPASGANPGAELLRNMTSNTSLSRNSFDLNFQIGGAVAPKLEIDIPRALLNIPTIGVEDLLTLDIGFAGNPETISSTNEAAIKYVGAA